ncbi:MAG: hypothetical protein IJT30_10565 [Muribaculaceae bacterium]|nr:hypothetical protein [Muribaculaceae bacterium]
MLTAVAAEIRLRLEKIVQTECNEACFDCRGDANFIQKLKTSFGFSLGLHNVALRAKLGCASEKLCKPSAMKLASIAKVPPILFKNSKQVLVFHSACTNFAA